jgi:hypothetical protein
MALTVETGAVIGGANTYITEANADTYFSNRNNPTAWTNLTSGNKEAALIYSTVALDWMFKWTGEITNLTQLLAWPRMDAEDGEGRTIAHNVIPQRVIDAQCELALLHAGTALNSTYDRGGEVRSEQVGPLKTEYFAGASVEPFVPILSRLVSGLGVARSNMMGELDRG